MIDFSCYNQTFHLPYNIRLLDSRSIVIDIAVAGFAEEDIEIQQLFHCTIAHGRKSTKEEGTIVYKGISERQFRFFIPTILLYKYQKHEVKNGLLSIYLEL